MCKTTIAIKKVTRDRLSKKWTNGKDTYDSVINRLLDEKDKVPVEEKKAVD